MSGRCNETVNRFFYSFIDKCVCFDILTSCLAELLIRDKTGLVIVIVAFDLHVITYLTQWQELKLPKYYLLAIAGIGDLPMLPIIMISV